MSQNAKNVQDAAFGALLGACTGDAAGATLEFIGRKPTPEEVTRAMRMPGGGVWGVAPGQITDDGELTLCLAHALSKSSDFPLERIAQNYAAWMQSAPFDRGMTISRAFGSVAYPGWQKTYGTDSYASAMCCTAAERSMGSKANGSLMRATPLGIRGHRLEPEILAMHARQDSSLSHPNPSCCDAVACYVIAIASLLQVPGDRQRAFAAALQWASAHADSEVQQWLGLAREGRNIPCHPQAGYIKIAFVHAFRHLLLKTDYEEALHETLCGGGDTDTNACIVGGLIGAACGADAIPDNMKKPVLSCDTTHGRHPRPAWLQTPQLADLTEQLLGVGFSSK